MDREFTIPGMTVRDLVVGEKILTISHEDDHLLRRFGQVDLIELGSGESLSVFRKKADEIWSVVSDAAAITLTDRRAESPGFEQQETLELQGAQPQAILVPFGVECQIHSVGGSRLVRLTTHRDGTEPGDKVPG